MTDKPGMGLGVCRCGCREKTKLAPKTSKRKGWIKGRPMKYLFRHLNRPSPFLFKIDNGTKCWIWQRSLRRGYGYLLIEGKKISAHRYFYENSKKKIPEGLTLDHLCRNRACVNPDHLEPVTMRENLLRGQSIQAMNAKKTHCINGHEFNEINTIYRRDGRRCKTCERERKSFYYQQKKAA